MPYEGQDRRQNGHCDLHVENSGKITATATEQAKLSSSYATLKWVVGVSLPILIMLSASSYNGATKQFDTVTNELKEIKALLTTSAVDRGIMNNRLTTVEQDLKEIKVQIEARHAR